MPRTEVAPGLVPRPRPAPEWSRSVPFRLPWSQTRVACRPVIGDALLLQYPEVAKALAEGSPSEEVVGREIIADVAATGGAE
jgi:hypothetical protein